MTDTESLIGLQKNIDQVMRMMEESRDGEPGEGCVVFAIKFQDFPNATGAERHTHFTFNAFGRGVDSFLISKHRQIMTKFSKNLDSAVSDAIKRIRDDPEVREDVLLGVLGTLLLDSLSPPLMEIRKK